MRVRRRTLVYVAAGLVLVVGAALAGAAGWLLNTQSGKAWVRSQIVSRLANGIHGKVYVGRLSGALLSAPVLDSLVIWDADDSVLVATGRIAFEYDVRDVWSGIIALRTATIDNLFVHVRRLPSNDWNYKAVFPKGSGAPRAPGRRLGDLVIFDSVTVRNGAFRWTEPWRPSAALGGSARDSAITYTLARTDLSVKRAGSGFVRARDWRALNGSLSYLRLRHPDSAGIAMRVAHLDVDEFDPPFLIRDARGTIAVRNDSARLDIDSFRLPGSSGSAHGTIVNKDGLAVAMRVVGDTVSLEDIAWLYPTFPKEGGGRMVLDIRRARTSNITEYELSRLDVSTTRSRLRGKMTWGVGDPVVRLTDVDAELVPVDFKLFEQFAGAPLALPWAGQLRGRVVGRGGPLDHFFIDSTAIEFTDANVPGVVNRFRGAGEVDIVRTLYTRFHDFALEVDHFDLRTLQAVNPEFPPLLGSVAGSARLDSLWYDVRFRDLNMRYLVDTSTSRFTGDGRLTLADEWVVYDMSLVAGPVSLDALARSYPKLPVRGTYNGGFTVRGSIDNLGVTADLLGEGGRVRADVRLDAFAPSFGGSGKVELFGIDPSRVLVDTAWRAGEITATIDAAIRGDSLANLDGEARVTLGRSTYHGLRLDRGRARVAFADGLMRVDTLTIDSDALTLVGAGALGLHAGRSDSLRFTATADSLGGLRPLLIRVPTGTPADSLAGRVHLTGRLSGNLDSLDGRATLRTEQVVYGTLTAQRFNVDAEVNDLLGRRVGRVAVIADTVVASDLRLQSVSADAQLTGGDSARVVARVASATGPVIDAAGHVDWDSLAVRTRFDSLHLVVADRSWRLARPAVLTVSRGTLVLDTLELRGAEGAALTMSAVLPDAGSARAALRADAFPLNDLGVLLQRPIPLSGLAALSASLGGTRDAPTIGFRIVAQQATVGETRIEGINASGQYLDRVLSVDAEVRSGGKPVMHADAKVPIDLTLRPVPKRFLDAPITGRLDADSTDLAVIETFSPMFRNAKGRFDAHLTLGGTIKEPDVTGRLEIINGSTQLPTLGVTYSDIRAYIRFFGDSVHIDTMSVRNGGSARVFGHISVADWADPRFELRFRTDGDFQVMKRVGVADVFLNTGSRGLLLAGRKSGSDLTGDITVNGSLYVPEALTKRVVEINPAELARIVDTTLFANRQLLPAAPPAVVRNMRVAGVNIIAGDNLRMRSDEANVRLTGALDLKVGVDAAGVRKLALAGTLRAEEGTFELNLGPLLQRTFTVRGGAIQFIDDPDIAPAISIQAVYLVRNYDPRDARQDVEILANIEGTLSKLSVSLSSEDAKVSQSDAISYLLTGGPNFAIGRRTSDYTSDVARSLAASLGSALTNSIRGLDEFSVDIANLGQGYGGGAKTVGGSLLAGTRIRTGFALNDRTFARLDAGLCQIGQYVGGNSQGLDPVAFADAIGGKIDYRVKVGLNLSVGVEPATSALLCAQGARARGFVPTPRQFALDLLRLWRF